MTDDRNIAEVRRSKLTDEEVRRRVEVVRRERPDLIEKLAEAPPQADMTLEQFRAEVLRFYNRQAIAAIVFSAGKCHGVVLPPKPEVLNQ